MQTPDGPTKTKAKDPEPAKPDPADSGGGAKKPPNVKNIVIGVLILLGLVGSLGAWLQGKASRQPQVNQLTEDLEACNTENDSCVAARTQLSERIEELEARVAVSRAVEQLVARNFGSAQENLNAAAEGLRERGHTALADRIAGVVLEPTDDIGAQRDDLLALARDVDRAIRQ